MSFRSILHLALHFAVPIAIALIWFRSRWLRASFIMSATMLIDLDHLLATPIYDPDRCSIGFHPLHRAPAIVIYIVLALIRRTRLVGIGLLIHIVLDALDCVAMKQSAMGFGRWDLGDGSLTDLPSSALTKASSFRIA